MAEIYVIFPASGEPLVSTMRATELKGDPINWHVRSYNPKVKKAKISFEKYEKIKQDGVEKEDLSKPRDFFGNKGKRPNDFHEYTRVLEGFDHRHPERGAECAIWGEAPKLGEPNYRPNKKQDKYTITGLTLADVVVEGAFLDPDIITDDP